VISLSHEPEKRFPMISLSHEPEKRFPNKQIVRSLYEPGVNLVASQNNGWGMAQ
jgi:hypothetical protein